jgi:tetratricopeptide (TPR) repeat protein
VYALVVILPVVTLTRMKVWKSSAALYTDILRKFPESFVALNSLGAELMMQNDDSNALRYLNKAIGVSPHNYKGYYNRGLLLLKNNKPREAINDFNQAISYQAARLP